MINLKYRTIHHTSKLKHKPSLFIPSDPASFYLNPPSSCPNAPSPDPWLCVSVVFQVCNLKRIQIIPFMLPCFSSEALSQAFNLSLSHLALCTFTAGFVGWMDFSQNKRAEARYCVKTSLLEKRAQICILLSAPLFGFYFFHCN